MTRLGVIALCGLLLLSGCQAQPQTSTTPEPTTAVTTVPTTTTTATTETTREPTSTTTTPTLNASIEYPDCHTVQIFSDSYSWIGIITENGSSEHHGQYTGTNEFETESVIVSVIVAHEGRDVEVQNPRYEECVAPPTTTTTVESTQTTTTQAPPSTTVQTPTTTPTPTTTRTTTQTPTTTTKPPLEEHRILEFSANETLGENATVVRELGNAHEYAVEFDYDIIWMQHRNGGSDKMLTVTRVHVTIPAGERVEISVRYPGSESVDWVRYEVRDLRYVDQ